IDKRFEEFYLCWGEGAHLDATCDQRADEFPLLPKGNRQEGTPTADIHDLGVVPLTYVGNVARAMLAHPANPWFINTDLFAANGDGHGTKISPRNAQVALVESQQQVINPTNPRRALNDRIERRLHIRRRAADDAEHFGGRRLMFQSFT